MKMYSFISKILVLVIVLGLLTGCGDSSNKPSPAPTAKATLPSSLRGTEVAISKPGTVVGFIEATSPSVYTVGFEYGEQKYPFFEEGGSSPHWIQVKLPGDGKAVTIYALRSHFANPEGGERMPSKWLLQGSNDGVNWIDIDKQEDQINWKPSEEREFKIKKPKNYSYYRLYVIEAKSINVVRVGNIVLKF